MVASNAIYFIFLRTMEEQLINCYNLLESAFQHAIQVQSSEATPCGIWMTEGGYQAGLHFQTGHNH